MNKIEKMISVVLPIRNEAEHIEKIVAKLLSQNYPSDKYELILVDGMSDDGTWEKIQKLSEKYDGVKTFKNPQLFSSAARNIGIKNARGEIILFVDGHVYLDNLNLFRDIVSLMSNKKVEVLSRPQLLDPPDNTIMQNVIAYARECALGHGLDSTIYCLKEHYIDPISSGACYTRNVIGKVGYFDESLDAAEDVDFNYRVHLAGFKSYTSPRLLIKYYPRKTLYGLFQQMVRYGVGRMNVFKKHKIIFRSGAFLFPLALWVILFILIQIVLSGESFLLLGGLTLLYLMLLVFMSIKISFSRGFKYFLLLIPTLITIHAGLAYGMLKSSFKFLTGNWNHYK